jgi:hypothetical protein
MNYDLDLCTDDNPLPDELFENDEPNDDGEDEDGRRDDDERDPFLTDAEADQNALDSVYGMDDTPFDGDGEADDLTFDA